MCRRLRHRFADWLHRLTFTATLHASLNPSRYSQTQAVVSGKGKPSIPHDFFQLAYLTRSLQCTTWSISTRQADCAIDRSGHTRVASTRTQNLSCLCQCQSDGLCNLSGCKSFQVLSMLKMLEIVAWMHDVFDEFCEFTTEERNPLEKMVVISPLSHHHTGPTWKICVFWASLETYFLRAV